MIFLFKFIQFLFVDQPASQPASKQASLPALLGQACWGGPGREGWQPSQNEPSYHCHYRAGSSDTITATSRYVNMFGSDYDHFKLEHYLRLFTSVLPCPDSSVFKSKTFPTSIKFPLFKVTPKCYSQKQEDEKMSVEQQQILLSIPEVVCLSIPEF